MHIPSLKEGSSAWPATPPGQTAPGWGPNARAPQAGARVTCRFELLGGCTHNAALRAHIACRPNVLVLEGSRAVCPKGHGAEGVFHGTRA